MKNRSTRVAALIWAAVMIAVISSTATMLLTGRSAGSGGIRWVSKSEYELIDRYRRLDEVRDVLMNQYYQPLEEDALLLGAINGMTGSIGDVYTFYYTPEQMARENANSEGHYYGIGVLIEQNADGYIEVLHVYPGSPAEAAGICEGDLVTHVAGEAVGTAGGRSYTDAVNMIRGEENTEVTLTIRRGGESFDLAVLRDDVNVSYLEYRMLDDGIGYVSISQFTGDAAERFEEAIAYFEAEGAKGMVIDVRDDPGGLLTVVNRIADAILPEGIIVYVQDREGKRTDYYSDADYCDLPLVVLANDMSASASEILCASVQALGRGTVVGLNTYGKGVVQSLLTFEEDGAGLQLTTSSYFDANGRSIHGVGVKPDVEVALDGDRVPLNPDPVSDNQLAVAIALLKQGAPADGE